MLSTKRLPGMAWLCLIMAVQSVSGFFGSGNGVRPGPLAQGGITWLYYKDLQKAAAWYEEVSRQMLSEFTSTDLHELSYSMRCVHSGEYLAFLYM